MLGSHKAEGDMGIIHLLQREAWRLREAESLPQGHTARESRVLNFLGLLGSQACMLSLFSCARLFATPWTVACQALLSMGFSRQEHWSGLPCPPPGDLLDPGIDSVSHTGIP